MSSQLERRLRPAQRTTSSRPTSTDRGFFELLVGAADQISLPLFEVGERAQVPHAVEEDDTVQMVELVLDDAGLEPGDEIVELAALAVQPLHPHGGVARHQAAQVGDRETSLPVVD